MTAAAGGGRLVRGGRGCGLVGSGRWRTLEARVLMTLIGRSVIRGVITVFKTPIGGRAVTVRVTATLRGCIA